MAKLDDILKEIGFTDELKVKISQGKVKSIPKQRIQRTARIDGLRIEYIIDEVIEINE